MALKKTNRIKKIFRKTLMAQEIVQLDVKLKDLLIGINQDKWIPKRKKKQDHQASKEIAQAKNGYHNLHRENIHT